MAEIDLSGLSALSVEERIQLAQAIWKTIPPDPATRSHDQLPGTAVDTWRVPGLDVESWISFFGADQLTYLHPSDDQLRADVQGFLQTFGLPHTIQFVGAQDFEISFAPLTSPIVGYNSLIGWGIFFDSELDTRLGEQLVIGQEDSIAGVASLCVERTTGVVSRLDITVAPPQTLVNSSVLQLGQSLQAVVEWSQEREQFRTIPADFTSQLEQRLRAIDRAAFAAAENYWPNLLATTNLRNSVWRVTSQQGSTQ
ncbi:SUKH-4 family immunity protein [Blastopirellula sp. J2-11]|uniref:SUKH-4 family immunity protein n=1 Tax=Blastopirellula sp. J2-11 TaxID=2943192 RepID=UPI0021C84076|nr:SUKH-4 family immunity protein [Blastopirellula sp. J2-11]UUO07527.1 SUKH-4 family immunity protein [Blastopirellula sp. J2-11]